MRQKVGELKIHNDRQNMEYKKRCQWCGKPFIAHKMTTLYCSKICIERAYKAKEKQKKIDAVEAEQSSQLPIVESVGNKPFLTPSEAAILLGLSKATLYRYLAQGLLKALQTPARTIIRRSDIERMFDTCHEYKKRSYHINKVSDTMTMKEIMEKYNITKKCAMRRIDKFQIPKIYEGRNVFYSKASIDKYFAELADEINLEQYYTPDQMMEKFNMTRSAVVSYALRHKIPRINRHHQVYYSKIHVDSLKGGSGFDPFYYTYEEIQYIYGFNLDQAKYYVKTYHVEKKKRGKFTLIRREDFDRIIKERMNGSLSIEEINAKIKNEQEVRAEEEIIDAPIEIAEYPDDDTVEDDGNYGKIPGYISAEEIAERYKQNKKWVHYLTRTKRVPRVQKAGFLFYDEKVVDELFSKYTSVDNITEWYTCDDIEQNINLPHYEPKHHPRMSMWNRAAQFAPFAALTGYDAAIQESNRVTEDWINLEESGNEELNRKMELILSKLSEQPHVTIEYFVPDEHKEGGSYQSYTGNIKRIDEYEKTMVMTDGKKIQLKMITNITDNNVI